MKSMTTPILRTIGILVATAVSLTLTHPCLALEYIRIRSNAVNIREAPDTKAASIAKASEGDIFELIREDGDWYSIEMFSGVPRFVHMDHAEKTEFRLYITMPPDAHAATVEVLKSIRAKARREADALYPLRNADEGPTSSQFDLNSKLLNELLDRYMLEALRNKNLQPPMYWYFVVEDEIAEMEKTPAATQ